MMKQQRLRVVSTCIAAYVLWICAAITFPGRSYALPVRPPKVIVVGAGMAGLMAAQRLKASGFDVIVLEARDRVGGRMNTSTNATGTVLDLGASWIHGDQPEFENFVAS